MQSTKRLGQRMSVTSATGRALVNPSVVPFSGSNAGVQHSDPLGPLRFALDLSCPLRTVTEANPQAHVVAYFDDVNVSDDARHAVQAFDRLTNGVLALDLTPVPRKSAVFGKNSDIAQAAAAELGRRHEIVVAGTAIGSDYFVEFLFRTKAQHVRTQVD